MYRQCTGWQKKSRISEFVDRFHSTCLKKIKTKTIILVIQVNYEKKLSFSSVHFWWHSLAENFRHMQMTWVNCMHINHHDWHRIVNESIPINHPVHAFTTTPTGKHVQTQSSTFPHLQPHQNRRNNEMLLFYSEQKHFQVFLAWYRVRRVRVPVGHIHMLILLQLSMYATI